MNRIRKKDITVIIPMYNSEKTIKAVIYAIINQSFSDYIFEIIVINDGSTDNSKSIVESIISESSIRINLINCENGGVSKARNIGLKNTKSNWIALCDSDDVWNTDKLKHQVEILNCNEEIDFLGGNHIATIQKVLFKKIDRLKRISVNELCLKVLPQTSTVIFKTKIIDKIGGFDEKQKYAEDCNFFMKIAANYNYYYDPVQVLIYGNGKNGFGESGLSANIKEMHKGFLKNIKEMYRLGYISFIFCKFALCVENIKYIRRIIVVGIKNKEIKR